ncbi:WYL domain-containing protein [uncultured Sphingomonas sp.]|uniref:WYL domain-containing protein n=1 Tax=uncultured Sphingomonas sp. TaxID=158754 RepID=UPI0035CBB81C
MYLTDESGPRKVVSTPLAFEAIVRQRCLVGTYNRQRVTLAPHALFTRNEALYLVAVTIDRDGQPPREAKIGLFKLDGLAGITLIERPFERSPLFEPADERFAATTLMAVEG